MAADHKMNARRHLFYNAAPRINLRLRCERPIFLPMRLLVVADPFLPVPPLRYGGVERVIASVIRAAKKAGHEVALVAHPASHLDGVSLYPLGDEQNPGPWANFENARRVLAAVRNFRPDLLHSFARLALLLPVLARPLPKIMSYQREPTAWTVQGALRLAGASLSFTGCSEMITQRGRPLGGVWEAIPNGIELELYRFQAAVEQGAPLIFLSRIERVKGAHHAIAAAKATGRRLILAGNHAESGPEAVYWRNEIAPHLNRDGISYVGPVDDAQKSELLGQGMALLVPIEWEEPFGLVFVEALACGTPVISHRRGALPEIVAEGQEGYLCKDSSQLPAAIERVSGIDRAACRRKVEACFSAEQMGARYLDLYRRRLGQATSHF